MATTKSNIFAVLDGEETEDVQQLIKHAKSKVASSRPSTSEKPKKVQPSLPSLQNHRAYKTSTSEKPEAHTKNEKDNKKVQQSDNRSYYVDHRVQGYNGYYQKNHGVVRQQGRAGLAGSSNRNEVNVGVSTEEDKAKRDESEKEGKQITLQQYEKVVAEKRKVLEAKKSEERKVQVDKQLESMQIVHKKKERDDDMLIKPNSGKDKLKRGKGDKERKGRKGTIAIDEFLKRADEEKETACQQFNMQITRPIWSISGDNISATPNTQDFPVLGK